MKTTSLFSRPQVTKATNSQLLSSDTPSPLPLHQNQRDLLQEILFMNQFYPKATSEPNLLPSFAAAAHSELLLRNMMALNLPMTSNTTNPSLNVKEEFEQITQKIQNKDSSDSSRAQLDTVPRVSSSTSEKLSKLEKIKSKTPAHGRRMWSEQEDQLLLKLIQQVGQNWALISKMMGNDRTGKQIRDRYLNKLSPQIKNEKWTEQEDQQLLELYSQKGHRWCEIARLMDGRTETMVKNRFYSKFKSFLNTSTGKGGSTVNEESSEGSQKQQETEQSNQSKLVLTQIDSKKFTEDNFSEKAERSLCFSKENSLERIPNPLMGNADFLRTSQPFAQGNLLQMIPSIRGLKAAAMNQEQQQQQQVGAATLNLLDFENVLNSTLKDYLLNQQKRLAFSNSSKETSSDNQSIQKIEDKLHELEYMIYNNNLPSSWIHLLRETIRGLYQRDSQQIPSNVKARGLEIIRAGISKLKGLFTKTIEDINEISKEINDILKE